MTRRIIKLWYPSAEFLCLDCCSQYCYKLVYIKHNGRLFTHVLPSFLAAEKSGFTSRHVTPWPRTTLSKYRITHGLEVDTK